MFTLLAPEVSTLLNGVQCQSFNVPGEPGLKGERVSRFGGEVKKTY